MLISALEIFNGGIMRKTVSILIFSAALFIGTFLVPVNTPTIYEEIYPLFSREEANHLLGKRVRNKFFSEEFAGMKIPLNAEENFISEKVEVGETGQVVALQEINHGFILVIKWDKQNKFGRDMFSYDGRFSSRVFLEFE